MHSGLQHRPDFYLVLGGPGIKVSSSMIQECVVFEAEKASNSKQSKGE